MTTSIATPAVEKQIAGFRVVTQPLDHDRGCDLLPDVLALFAPIGGALAGTLAGASTNGLELTSALTEITNLDTIVERALSGLGAALSGGKLKSLEARLLVATSVVLPLGPNGVDIRVDLGDAADRNRAFTGRKKLWLGVMAFALEVNFKDFLDVKGLIEKATLMRSA